MEPTRDLSTDELVGAAEAGWWRGAIDDALRLEENAHERLLGDGRTADAALRALRIALMWGTRGDLSLTQAWLGRAQRLLDEEPPCAAHGYADYLQATFALDLGDDPAEAAAASDRVRAVARQFPDHNLDCFALTLAGMAAIRSGDLRGFAALDEAMIPVIGGKSDPLWGGDIFCSVIHLCESLGDVGRMKSWTRALEAWASPLSSTFLWVGVTRVHQLQLLRMAGDWDVVEREAAAVSDVLAPQHGWVAAAGFYELGEVHRLRGRAQEAQTAYDRARELGVEPQPGEALLLQASGESARAMDGLRIALAGGTPLERARILPTAVALAAAAGELDQALRMADELDATAGWFGTPGLLAGAARGRASCLAAAARWDDAEAALESAARIHRQQGQRHELAEVYEALAAVHRGRGDGDRAASAEATARAIYSALGAVASLARLDDRAAPAGLTAREVEVLIHVAAGLSNREVAQALVISDKTVGRHLSNIFVKTGVTSRTGAAAWARDNGVV